MTRFFKKIISLLLLSALLLTMQPRGYCDESPFSDVDRPSAWYYSAVLYCYQRGLVRGTTSTTFSPNDMLTRAQMIVILYSAAGRPHSSFQHQFRDAQSGWYQSALNWAVEQKITSGISEYEFAPDKPLTRTEAVAFLYRYARWLGYGCGESAGLDDFSDAGSVQSWGKKAVSWAVYWHIIAGSVMNGSRYLSPNKNATRAETAVILMGFLEQFQQIVPLEDSPGAETICVESANDVDEYGNVLLSDSSRELLCSAFQPADTVTLRIAGKTVELPVVPDVHYVKRGQPALVLPQDGTSRPFLSLNGGSFAEYVGLDADCGQDPSMCFPSPVTVRMLSSQGYLDQYILLDLFLSSRKDDYPDQSDEEFADFRALSTEGIGAGKLYRGASPMVPSSERAACADEAARQAGVKTFIILAEDDTALLHGLDPDAYYAQNMFHVISFDANRDLPAQALQLSEIFRLLGEAATPVMVCCELGRDETGYICAILEALWGASCQEIVEDYMLSFEQLHYLERGSEYYGRIEARFLSRFLALLQIEDPDTADFCDAAEQYLLSLGLNWKEIDSIRYRFGNEDYQYYELTMECERSFYPDLSDEDFSNFRLCKTTGMGEHLYRGPSPIYPSGRHGYVSRAIENAGVTVILNLANDEETAASYSFYQNSYYSQQKVLYLPLGFQTNLENYKQSVGVGLRYMIDNPGTYFLHCVEGKDRTGFWCALLECLMGASLEEVTSDYLKTYANYYSVLKTEDGLRHVQLSPYQLHTIARDRFYPELCRAFQISDLKNADLQQEARAYIWECGLSPEEIEMLMERLQ